MGRVTSILIYPEKDEPGQSLDVSFVSEEGLDGDRRKKSPVHLVVVADYVDQHPRANLVVDLDRDELDALVGRRLQIGTVQLDVASAAGTCPGVYASVPVPGDVTVGDVVTVGIPDGP